VEVLSTEAEGMIEEGREIVAWHPNVVVKLPSTPDGLEAMATLSRQGVAINQTLCFSVNQALLGAQAGASFVSPFVGRLDDEGHDGMAVVADIVEIFRRYGIGTKVMAASIRHPMHCVAAAKAGADIVAPSDMMDGRVGAIRRALDRAGFAQTPVMAYSAKFASAFYGPFREAAHSTPQFGDRKSYQMDYANQREALKEAQRDVQEGADWVMVKPALPYLDVISLLRRELSVPIVAYNVSGEYSMIKAASQLKWLDEQSAVLESLTAIKRAGANLIITYYAQEALKWL